MIEKLDELITRMGDIAGYWNGSDERFVGGDGEPYSEDEAHQAMEIINKVKELKELIIGLEEM